MKVMIEENQRGILFRNGKFSEYLKPGRYWRFGGKIRLQVLFLEEGVPVDDALEQIMKDEAAKEEIERVQVPDGMAAIHLINGNYNGTLDSGPHAFFRVNRKHEFRMADIQTPEVPSDFPRCLLEKLPSVLVTRVEVQDYQKGLLFFDGRFERILEPGTHFFWNGGVRVRAELIDTRCRQMEISGQEMMTLDKVTLRMNFVCSYRVTDPVRAFSAAEDPEKLIRAQVQLALRDHIGRYRLDELLENRDSVSEKVLEILREKEETYAVSFLEAGVKDLILPGEIRDIMNTVLLAEKRAQANVITRREEVASTRSLLNTARLMDENQTLYKLKQLEYLEKICGNVGNISVDGSKGIVDQLARILGAG